ncbi:MAG: hypothetical protein M3389_15890, partial [Actinomycetota bacterium]|nr:hypothetical protein [Actinomycetota bacterium]
MTDWSLLLHAYGTATDTPGHLERLAHGDDADARLALDHLWSAVLHQGSVYTATAPVVLHLARELPSLRTAEHQAQALAFVAEAARQTAEWPDVERAEGGDDMDAMFAEAIVAMREAAPEAATAVAPFAGHDDEEVRIAAYDAIA